MRLQRRMLLALALPLSLPLWAAGMGMGSPAWVMLASAMDGTTVAYARAIVPPDDACPLLEPVGEGADGSAAGVVMVPRNNPHGFAVRVCEARIAFDTGYRVRLGDRVINLPRARKQPGRIIVLGDTGCELSGDKHPHGCAKGERAEPFATVASSAANSGPVDLLLHVGDYIYRGTPHHLHFTQPDGSSRKVSVYDAGDHRPRSAHCDQAVGSGYISQNDPRSDSPDGWPNWRDDFFRPAGRLLIAAPWVFARGNHELCSRAGPGWFYFLDGGSNLPGGSGQLSCPLPKAQADPVPQLVFGQPFELDLGNLGLWVMDSANACDGFAPVEAVTQRYAQQFRQVAALAPAQRPAWLVSHRPLNAVATFDGEFGLACSDALRFGCSNQTLQAALRVSSGDLPVELRLVLSGHMHQFQASTTGESLPMSQPSQLSQLIIGNSGVSLFAEGPVGDFQYRQAERQARGVGIGRSVAGRAGAAPVPAFGYMDIRYQGDGRWQGRLMNGLEAGLVMARCGSESARRGAVCELPAASD